MITEHFSKINLSLGVLVVACFFLPWLSIDCGNTTIVKLSGFDLATGHVTLEQRADQQLTQSGKDFNTLESEHPVRPQLYLMVVIVCALVIVGYSVRMFREMDRVGMFAVGAFGVFGFLVMVVAAVREFGVDIPPDVAQMVRVPRQPAFYMSVVSFLGVVVLSVIGLRASAEPSREVISLNIPLASDEQLQNIIDELPRQEESSLPAGENAFGESSGSLASSVQFRICPSCGEKFSIQQEICPKCGTLITTKG
jgi:zinc ribbon protein